MKFSLLLIAFMMAGCAAYKNYNQTTKGKVFIRGGIYKEESWDDVMTFRRMSWYHGVTLYYDALFYKADLDSPFSKWFSPSEKEFFTKCEDFLVTVTYSADPTKISHVNFREQMKLNGYDDVIINTFASYLKVHPSANEWRFQNYKIMGFCKRSPSRLGTDHIGINFPSFRYLEVNP